MGFAPFIFFRKLLFIWFAFPITKKYIYNQYLKTVFLRGVNSGEEYLMDIFIDRYLEDLGSQEEIDRFLGQDVVTCHETIEDYAGIDFFC